MVDDTHMTGLVLHPQHIAQVWQQWADRGEPMPFALVQGGEPALPFISGMPLPDGVEEAGYLGALLGEPLELVQCETVDLQVPASAEIVIEGHLSVERTGLEGPMGEFAGYRPSETSMQPVYTIEAITHRDNPIWPTVVEGEPVDEYHTATGLTLAAEALTALRAANLPVTSAWEPFDGASHILVISVATDWRDKLPGLSTGDLTQRITDVIAAQRFEYLVPRVFVLDDDVDAADTGELMWALATRVHPTGRRSCARARCCPCSPCTRRTSGTPGRDPRSPTTPCSPPTKRAASPGAPSDSSSRRKSSSGCWSTGTTDPDRQARRVTRRITTAEHPDCLPPSVCPCRGPSLDRDSGSAWFPSPGAWGGALVVTVARPGELRRDQAVRRLCRTVGCRHDRDPDLDSPRRLRAAHGR